MTQQEQKKAKPPQNKLPKMKAACVCSAQHHRGNIEGGNSRECRSAYTADPMGMFAPRTGCVTCNCDCLALFNIEDHAMIQREIAGGILKPAGPIGIKQPPISTYYLR
jgi:hypothetical protein